MDFLFTETPLKYMIEPLWRDEAFSVMLALQGWGNLLITTAKDFNPPFYYLLLKFWITLFGPSEIALRSLSLIFYLGTIYIADHIFQDIFKLSFKRRVLYLLIVALNPLLLYYGFEGRMYSMSAFFATASFYAFFLKKKGLYTWVTVLGLYTHYFMVFAIASQWIYEKFIERSKDRLKLIYHSVLWFIPWGIFLVTMKPASSTDFWLEKVKVNQLTTFLGVLYTGYEKSLWFLYKEGSLHPPLLVQFSFLALIGILFGLYLNRTRPKHSLYWYFLLWALLGPLTVFLISFVKPVYYPRYLIYASVGLSILFCYLLEKTPLILRVIFIALLLNFSWNYQELQLTHRHKKYPAEAIKKIKPLLGPQDKLFVTDSLDYFVAQYYVGPSRVALYGVPYMEIPSYVGKALIPESSLESTPPYYPQRAFILHGDGSYEIQSLY